MTWNNHESPSVPPALNELGSDTPLYLHVSERPAERDQDVFEELRAIRLGTAATGKTVVLTETTGYARKHGETIDVPEGLTFSA